MFKFVFTFHDFYFFYLNCNANTLVEIKFISVNAFILLHTKFFDLYAFANGFIENFLPIYAHRFIDGTVFDIVALGAVFTVNGSLGTQIPLLRWSQFVAFTDCCVKFPTSFAWLNIFAPSSSYTLTWFWIPRVIFQTQSSLNTTVSVFTFNFFCDWDILNKMLRQYLKSP